MIKLTRTLVLILPIVAFLSCEKHTVNTHAGIINHEFWGERKSGDSVILISPYKVTANYIFYWVKPMKYPVRIKEMKKKNIQIIDQRAIFIHKDSLLDDFKLLSMQGKIRLVSELVINDDSLDGFMYMMRRKDNKTYVKLPLTIFFEDLSSFSRKNDSLYRLGEEKLFEAFAKMKGID